MLISNSNNSRFASMKRRRIRAMEKDIIQEAENIAKTVGIPSQPQILVGINKEMSKSTPEFSRLLNLVSKDLGITAKLIKVANSAYFGLGYEVNSIDKALSVLGLHNFNTIVVASALRDALMSNHLPHQQFETFYSHSISVAKVSQLIAQKIQLPIIDSVFFNTSYMAGLFHDCGILLVAKRFQDYYDTIASGLGEGYNITKIEEKNFKTNHCVVGSFVARSWQLPNIVCKVIQHHHDLDISLHSDEKVRKMLCVVILAEDIVYHCTKSDNNGYVDLYNSKIEDETFHTQLLSELNITSEELSEVKDVAEHISNNMF